MAADREKSLRDIIKKNKQLIRNTVQRCRLRYSLPVTLACKFPILLITKKAKQSQLILLETQYSLKRVAYAISVPVTPEDKFRFIYRQPFQVSSEISEG